MPYYFGEGDPGWEAYIEESEGRFLADLPAVRPLDNFKFVDPWQAKTTILKFPKVPGSPPEPIYIAGFRKVPTKQSARKPGWLGRLFGSRSAPVPPPEWEPTGTLSEPEQFALEWEKQEKSINANAIYNVSKHAQTLRELGVKRFFARYDGGNDEDFVHFIGVEMTNGQKLARDEAKFPSVEAIANSAVTALMGGGFGTGPFEVFGAITIDCEACTITDEKDTNLVFIDPELDA
jgi:hypothetical protein